MKALPETNHAGRTIWRVQYFVAKRRIRKTFHSKEEADAWIACNRSIAVDEGRIFWEAWHGISNAERHELMDALILMRDGRKPLKWRGGHNWLGHFGPIHRRTDGKKRPMTTKAFVAYCRAGARDKYGRRRKRVAYRCVLNPTNLMQYALRDLCLRAPEQANAFFLRAFAFLRRRLRKEFPGVPLQLAFHCKPGRAHWEFIIPKYNARNRKVRPGVRLDGPYTSIAHAEAFVRTCQPVPGSIPLLNSDIELEFYRYLILRYRHVLHRAGLGPPLKNEVMEAEKSFLLQQEASLKDRSLSQNLIWAKAAQRELVWNRARQRDLRLRIVARVRKAFIQTGPIRASSRILSSRRISPKSARAKPSTMPFVPPPPPVYSVVLDTSLPAPAPSST